MAKPLMRSGAMDTDDDDEAESITPALLADDDVLRDALANACTQASEASPCECIEQKLSFLRGCLDEGTFAIIAELVEALTKHHEDVVCVVVRDVLWTWAESDAANGVRSGPGA